MRQFILLRTLKENYTFIIDVLKMLLGNSIEAKVQNEYLLLYHNGCEEQEVIDTIRSLESDLNTSIICYQSSTKDSSLELTLILDIFLQANYNYYNFKTLLTEAKEILKADEILNFILDGTGVTPQIIKAMADCDLNVSKAAQSLFMHRNTLLYKIERLLDISGFDLKSFNDVFILNKLLKA